MFNVKEHLKDVLPDWLFSLIAKDQKEHYILNAA